MPTHQAPRMRCPECRATLPPVGIDHLPPRLDCTCGASYENAGYFDMLASHDREEAQLDYTPGKGREERVSGELKGQGARRLRRQYWDTFLPRLASLAPAGSSKALLDVGMALVRGHRPKAAHVSLPEHFPLYAAVDPSSVQMRYVAEGDNLPGLYMLGVAENLPFENAQFEAVVILHVLDHCFDAQLALAEAARVLKPGGVCAVALNNDGSWFKTVLRSRARRAREAAVAEHNWFFTPPILERMLAEADLQVISRYEWSYVPITRPTRNPLIGVPWQAAVAAAEAVGRTLLPGRGGKFVVHARKPGGADAPTEPAGRVRLSPRGS